MSKRGENIYKRKDGRWEGRYKNGFRSNGTVKYKSVYGRSYSEVRAILREKRLTAADDTVHCQCLFREIAQNWLINIKRAVKESTYVNYFTKLHKHILPVFGEVKYEKLTVEMLNDFATQKLSENLSPKYEYDIVSVIKSISHYARKAYHYPDIAMVTIQKEKRTAEKPLLTGQQQITLTAHLLNCPTASNIGILLSMYTGIRIGELCALQWSDIDLEKSILTVNRTMQRLKNFDGKAATRILVGSPKSRTSARQIPLPEFLVDILKTIRTEPENYVLTGQKLFVEPRTMQYRFSSILKKLGLPKVNFHALRHLFATNCIALGFDVKTLSEILGHSSVEITLNRYVHSSMERKRTCMELLNRQMSCQ